MAAWKPADAAKWVAQKLRSRPGVTGVDIAEPQILLVHRSGHPPFYLGIVATACVEKSTLEPILDSKLDAELIINVPKEAIWTGEAIKAAKNANAAFGGMKELHSAMWDESPRLFVDKEIAFVERALSQHSLVTGIERVHDRKYRIQRKRGGDFTVVLINEYEVTADHVRTAQSRYGDFDAVLITNGYGTATTNAKNAAASMGAEVFKIGELFSRLHRT